MRTGNFFGETVLFKGRTSRRQAARRERTVIAMEDCELAYLTTDEITEIRQ